MSDEQFGIICRKIDNIANVLVILGGAFMFGLLAFGTMLLMK